MIKLNEQQNKEWKKVRDQAIDNLVSEFDVATLQEWQRLAINKGVSRLIDEKFNTADRKLSAVDDGADFVVHSVKEIKVSDKETLVKEIMSMSSLFTEDMLKKLNTNDLRALKDRL